MIRQAQTADVSSIVQIRDSVTIDMSRINDSDYTVTMQKQGFLLPTEPDEEQLLSELSDYRVAERDGSLVGFYALHADQGMTPDQKGVVWLKPALREPYFSKPHARLSAVSVQATTKRHGVGTEMLQDAEQWAIKQGSAYIFAFVALTPVTNFASMIFHEKNGFERAATSLPYLFIAENGFQLEGYQFFLYGKKLS